MVSLIGWIVTIGSCEDFNSKIVDEPGFVETTHNDSGICEDDFSPEVLIVLVSIEGCCLCRPEIAYGGKGGLNDILRERRGKGCSSSMMTNLFYDQK